MIEIRLIISKEDKEYKAGGTFEIKVSFANISKIVYTITKRK